MSERRTHPLAARYLDELERLLAGVHPSERAEVVEGVREHLELSLAGTSGSDAAVRSALDELGPAAEVAEAAYDGRPAGIPPGPVLVRPVVVPATSRSWVPVLVATFDLIALLLVMATILSTPVGGGSSGPGVSPEDGVGFGEVVFVAVFATLGGSFFWVPTVPLVLVSRLWRPAEKLALVLLVPVTALGLSAPWVPPFRTWSPAGLLALSLVVLGVALYVLASRVVRGTRRAAALVSGAA